MHSPIRAGNGKTDDGSIAPQSALLMGATSLGCRKIPITVRRDKTSMIALRAHPWS
jgi:hypothetical protein